MDKDEYCITMINVLQNMTYEDYEKNPLLHHNLTRREFRRLRQELIDEYNQYKSGIKK